MGLWQRDQQPEYTLTSLPTCPTNQDQLTRLQHLVHLRMLWPCLGHHPTPVGRRCSMQSKTLFVVVLLAFAGICTRVGAGGNHQDYINFKGADGSPMGVERVGDGFLLAQAGLFFTV